MLINGGLLICGVIGYQDLYPRPAICFKTSSLQNTKSRNKLPKFGHCATFTGHLEQSLLNFWCLLRIKLICSCNYLKLHEEIIKQLLKYPQKTSKIVKFIFTTLKLKVLDRHSELIVLNRVAESAGTRARRASEGSSAPVKRSRTIHKKRVALNSWISNTPFSKVHRLNRGNLPVNGILLNH